MLLIIIISYKCRHIRWHSHLFPFGSKKESPKKI